MTGFSNCRSIHTYLHWSYLRHYFSVCIINEFICLNYKRIYTSIYCRICYAKCSCFLFTLQCSCSCCCTELSADHHNAMGCWTTDTYLHSSLHRVLRIWSVPNSIRCLHDTVSFSCSSAYRVIVVPLSPSSIIRY